MAAGLALLSRVGSGDGYLTTVLPGIIVFGCGLSLTVAPLTAAVLGAVDPNHAGVASGVNNSVARIAGLLGVALMPIAAGFASSNAFGGPAFAGGFVRVMWVAAGLCVLGACIAALTVRGRPRVRSVSHTTHQQACGDAALVD
jgi:hypothetical protein